MPVNDTHVQYNAAYQRWRTSRDAAEGQEAIKLGREAYLPGLKSMTEDDYDTYLKLAYYVNVTGRTRAGLVGAVFRKDPTYEVPKELEYLIENFDGAGQSAIQVAKKCISDQTTVGRYGFLTDFPAVEEGLNSEQKRLLDIKPSVKSYSAETIINWKSAIINGRAVLSLVVLLERVEARNVDEFSSDEENQYRVLMLIDGVYVQRVYDHALILVSESIPTDDSGKAWPVIPFVFAGSENNTPDVDNSPLFDLANINIAHYRNIADHESSLRTFSQVMLHVDTGSMDNNEFNDANPGGVMFGGSFGLQTSNGGSASILQADPHSKCSEAISAKAEQMVSVGARLISKEGINQTAEEARINASSEHSVLDTIVGNCSEAMEQSLEYAAIFLGVDPKDVKYELNREYFDRTISPQEHMAYMQYADRGDISQADIRTILRKSGVISETRTDEEIDGDVEVTAPI